MAARRLLALAVLSVNGAGAARLGLAKTGSALRHAQLNIKHHSHTNNSFETLGASGPAPAPAPAGGPSSAPAASPPVGLCGCARSDECTCGGSLDYLQCVHEACDKGCGDCEALSGPWSNQCTQMTGDCADTVNIGCHDSVATCEGKFHQATYGVAGLTLELGHLSEEAFCGPWGKCLGELHLAANVHKPAAGMVMECVVPVAHDDPETVYYCNSEVVDGTSKCTLPMLKKLPKGEKVEGHCYILDSHHYQITKDAFFVVQNRYDENWEADKAKEMKKEVKTEKKLKKEQKEKSDAGDHPRMFGLAAVIAGLAALCTN